MNAKPLSNVRLLMFVDDKYEDLELWYPRLRMMEEGIHVTVAGPEGDRTYVGKHGYPCKSDAALRDMIVEDFDGVIIPGGFMPDKLRRDPHVLHLVQDFVAEGKMVASICHGGWIPISAKVYNGIRVTGSPGIKDDLINAGAIWHDTASVVVDGLFVSAQGPNDLPEFCRAMLQVLAPLAVAVVEAK